MTNSQYSPHLALLLPVPHVQYVLEDMMLHPRRLGGTTEELKSPGDGFMVIVRGTSFPKSLTQSIPSNKSSWSRVLHRLKQVTIEMSVRMPDLSPQDRLSFHPGLSESERSAWMFGVK